MRLYNYKRLLLERLKFVTHTHLPLRHLNPLVGVFAKLTEFLECFSFRGKKHVLHSATTDDFRAASIVLLEYDNGNSCHVGVV